MRARRRRRLIERNSNPLDDVTLPSGAYTKRARARSVAEWRRGSLRFGGPGTEALSFTPVNFGVVWSSVGTGGTQAIYLGLAKDRQPRVRPTLLEQTDIQSLVFDFVKKRLTL